MLARDLFFPSTSSPSKTWMSWGLVGRGSVCRWQTVGGRRWRRGIAHRGLVCSSRENLRTWEMFGTAASSKGWFLAGECSYNHSSYAKAKDLWLDNVWACGRRRTQSTWGEFACARSRVPLIRSLLPPAWAVSGGVETPGSCPGLQSISSLMHFSPTTRPLPIQAKAAVREVVNFVRIDFVSEIEIKWRFPRLTIAT